VVLVSADIKTTMIYVSSGKSHIKGAGGETECHQASPDSIEKFSTNKSNAMLADSLGIALVDKDRPYIRGYSYWSDIRLQPCTEAIRRRICPRSADGHVPFQEALAKGEVVMSVDPSASPFSIRDVRAGFNRTGI
jgi:hypothetical protein